MRVRYRFTCARIDLLYMYNSNTAYSYNGTRAWHVITYIATCVFWRIECGLYRLCLTRMLQAQYRFASIPEECSVAKNVGFIYDLWLCEKEWWWCDDQDTQQHTFDMWINLPHNTMYTYRYSVCGKYKVQWQTCVFVCYTYWTYA